ncbi:MAG: Ig-like domain-containing protein [Myxococcales bacterium]|nr:Ig-like domain-containing protein [Myxococcales bacterium]
MKPNSRRLPAILCLCALLAACDFDPGADSGQGPSALDDAGLRDGASAAGSQDGGAEVAGTFFVVSTTPEAGAKGVALDAGVTLTFSVPIDPSTLTAASVRLLDETGAELPASLMAEGAVAKLTPLAPLALLTGFRVEVSQNVRSQSGAGLVSSFSLEFESREGTWSEPLVLDANLGEDLRQPAVAMNDRGGALVVWSVLTPAFFPTSGAILATYRPSGGQWSLPTALNGPGERARGLPQLGRARRQGMGGLANVPHPGALGEACGGSHARRTAMGTTSRFIRDRQCGASGTSGGGPFKRKGSGGVGAARPQSRAQADRGESLRGRKLAAARGAQRRC